MFTQKLANSAALRWGILFVLVATLLVGMVVMLNVSFAPLSHQVAFGPSSGTCSISISLSGSSTLCLPTIQPLASWGS